MKTGESTQAQRISQRTTVLKVKKNSGFTHYPDKDRQIIAKQVEQFLNNGGKIEMHEAECTAISKVQTGSDLVSHVGF